MGEQFALVVFKGFWTLSRLKQDFTMLLRWLYEVSLELCDGDDILDIEL